jgi:hypothetical protein
VIGNFNPDYPEAFVLVPTTGEVFHVGLISDSSPANAEYVIQPEYRKDWSKILASKIMRDGIARTVMLPNQ